MRRNDGTFGILSSRGLPPGAPSTLGFEAPPDDLMALGPGDEARARHGLVLLCPIHRRERLIAVLGLGPRAAGLAYGAEEHAFLRSVAACAATPIENGLIYDELRRVNQKLSVKVFQLHNLFDISRTYLGDAELAARAGHAWSALSRACHHHPYELAPTAGELQGRFGVVGELIRKVARSVDESARPPASRLS